MDKNANKILTKGEFKKTLYRRFHFTDVDKFEAVYEKYELDSFFNYLDKMQPKLAVDEFNKIVLAAREKVFFSKNLIAKQFQICLFIIINGNKKDTIITK